MSSKVILVMSVFRQCLVGSSTRGMFCRAFPQLMASIFMRRHRYSKKAHKHEPGDCCRNRMSCVTWSLKFHNFVHLHARAV